MFPIAPKSKSLLKTATSTKSKKQDKYSEQSSIKQKYKFEVEDNVVYLGLESKYSKYRGLDCTITKRSRRKIIEYYTVKFADNEELNSVEGGFLRTSEEYEKELEIAKNKEDGIKNISEEELRIIEQGLEPLYNPLTCMNPIIFFEMRCGECGFENRCIYKNKHDYKKLDIR